MYKKSNITSNSIYASPELYEHSHVSSVENVYETSNELLEMLVKQSLQTRQIREELHNQLGALGQKYINMLFVTEMRSITFMAYISARTARCKYSR